ncbi:amino acid adenylation domain-containing protein [Paracoccus sp. MBLB3053]|uniref:Amino acid adenylation domain-containing protein n=1 Tax=Paracoccus aurantius TaxID=3073814 RepID=A0ABU2HUW3_9RHOB|nr:amino acid adenylation domain-containing protein [Paracoccus sp. MBLB3053]MDS9468838.1 amino acid adenylation domain-containing protein [Paracoccus sp. MBLB3053]
MTLDISSVDLPSRPALPLTEAQEGMWFAQSIDPTNPILNTGQYVELIGALDVERFRTAHAATMAQCEALRARFGFVDGRPVQWLDARPPVLECADLSGFADPEAEALARMASDSARALDLSCDQLARFCLFRLGPQRHFWYQRLHHLVIDGYGIVLLTNRMAEIYSALTIDAPLPEPFAPVADALAEDAAYRVSPHRSRDAAFWQTELAGLERAASPAQGRALSAHGFHRRRIELDPDFCANLRRAASDLGRAWPDLLTLLATDYLSRVSGEGDRVVGIPHALRFGSKAARVPCMWMNVLPLRWSADEQRPLAETLQDGAARLARIRRHGRYRSEQLRRDLHRTAPEDRLYGPIVNLQPFDIPPRFAGLDVRLHILGAGAVDDLSVTFRGDAEASLALEIDANPLLYAATETASHAERLAGYLAGAFGAGRLADVQTVTPAEHAQLTRDVNATDRALEPTSLTALIEAQMKARPDAEAVRFGEVSLSYAELDRRSAALTEVLVALGAGPDRLVAIALPRCEHLAVALLAVLRAGSAYVPLDPENPPARLARLIARTDAAILLAETGLDCDGAAIPFAPQDWPHERAKTSGQQGSEVPLPRPAPDDLAYVLFTSGSTGEPKGVMIEHRSIVNRLLWMRDHYGFTRSDRILQKTPITFDVSVWELFLPFLCGGTLVLAPPGAHRDPSAIAELIRRENITAIHFVPSMLSAFLASPASQGVALDRVFCSGEALTAEHREKFHSHIRAELHNLYGPTEAAVDVSYWEAGPQDTSRPLPIGHPVWNTRLYILDPLGRPVPEGVAGELFLGGVQLARGYLGQPDLTAKSFLSDPFRPGERIYATGDLAMRRADGAVTYLGRRDQQVKIRGMRVELGEIEAALHSSTMLDEAVVLPRPLGDGLQLVAYVVPKAGLDATRLQAHLARHLPAHMIPAHIMPLSALPVTANGKLDRAALPAPEVAAPKGTPAKGPIETRLAALYAEILSLPQTPMREADFFALGGDSLSALSLLLSISREFGHDPGLGQIFETPVISALATALETGREDAGLGMILPLRHASGGAPLFLLHPAGGLGWCYRRLAPALDDRPVYALQSPLLDGGPVPASLGELAAIYLRAITDLAPEGMIHLAGWSVGGVLAHEIAVQLQDRGREVGMLALLDAYPAETWRALPELDDAASLRALLAIAGHDPEAHPELETRAKVVNFLRRGDSSLATLPETVLDAVTRLVAGTNRLLRSHLHRRFGGSVLHFCAAGQNGNRFDPALWLEHAEALERIDLPFRHAEMVNATAARLIGPVLIRRMRGFGA